MANKDDPSSTNKSHLRVVDDGQIQSVAKSLRESTNGTIVGSCNTKAVDSINSLCSDWQLYSFWLITCHSPETSMFLILSPWSAEFHRFPGHKYTYKIYSPES